MVSRSVVEVGAYFAAVHNVMSKIGVSALSASPIV